MPELPKDMTYGDAITQALKCAKLLHELGDGEGEKQWLEVAMLLDLLARKNYLRPEVEQEKSVK